MTSPTLQSTPTHIPPRIDGDADLLNAIGPTMPSTLESDAPGPGLKWGVKVGEYVFENTKGWYIAGPEKNSMHYLSKRGEWTMGVDWERNTPHGVWATRKEAVAFLNRPTTPPPPDYQPPTSEVLDRMFAETDKAHAADLDAIHKDLGIGEVPTVTAFVGANEFDNIPKRPTVYAVHALCKPVGRNVEPYWYLTLGSSTPLSAIESARNDKELSHLRVITIPGD